MQHQSPAALWSMLLDSMLSDSMPVDVPSPTPPAAQPIEVSAAAVPIPTERPYQPNPDDSAAASSMPAVPSAADLASAAVHMPSAAALELCLTLPGIQ